VLRYPHKTALFLPFGGQKYFGAGFDYQTFPRFRRICWKTGLAHGWIRSILCPCSIFFRSKESVRYPSPIQVSGRGPHMLPVRELGYGYHSKGVRRQSLSRSSFGGGILFVLKELAFSRRPLRSPIFFSPPCCRSGELRSGSIHEEPSFFPTVIAPY